MTSIARTPVAFSFNIRRSVYEHFGLSHFGHIQKKYGLHLLPVVADNDSCIETRSQALKERLGKLLDKLQTDRLHLVSYSLSGIDARYAISALGVAPHVQTLITISTPHKGSLLADIFENKGLDDPTINFVTRAMGVGTRAFTEMVPENIASFNAVTLNNQNVRYYSMGGQTHKTTCNPIYKSTCEYLMTKTRRHVPQDNDGVFRVSEIEWGNHVCNFDYDHSQIVGMGGYRGEPFQLIQDIIKKESESAATSR